MDRKTYSPKKSEVTRDWFVVDAQGKTLGRLATVIAATLRGKNKPIYANHVDTGDFVIVVNADKIAVTGKKETQKNYDRAERHARHLPRPDHQVSCSRHAAEERAWGSAVQETQGVRWSRASARG